MEGAQNHLYIIWNNIKNKSGSGAYNSKEWPTGNSDRTVYFKTVLGLILRTEAQIYLKTKRDGSYTLIEAYVCVILNLKGKKSRNPSFDF